MTTFATDWKYEERERRSEDEVMRLIERLYWEHGGSWYRLLQHLRRIERWQREQ
jgi:hypothetical protein